MIEPKRAKLIKRLFKDEIKNYVYEEYIASDNIRRVRSYITLNDGVNTLVKLAELGVATDEVINELKNSGYKSMYNSPVLIKK